MQLSKEIGHYLSQSQAAALAVLCANIRSEHNETKTIGNAGSVRVEEDSEVDRAVMSFFQELEAIAVNSIAKNDGQVVHWIGVAAKQMNPLLN